MVFDLLVRGIRSEGRGKNADALKKEPDNRECPEAGKQKSQLQLVPGTSKGGAWW